MHFVTIASLGSGSSNKMSSKKAYIYEEILGRLFNGQYRFGDRLTVKEISEETGVSKQPIMTALYRLQDNGFVRITAQVGCQVVEPTTDEVSDFYRMFAQIEGLIGEFAAERATQEDLIQLKVINDQLANIDPKRPDAADLYRKLNVAFHKQLHAMARSPLVCSRQLANFELSDFYLVQTGGFNIHLGFVFDEHERIIDAIARKDAKAAGQFAREHIDSVAQHLADHLKTTEVLNAKYVQRA